MKQTITVELELKPNQPSYSLVESSPKPYEALRHFFEDISYKVVSISAHTTK
jgi:hypothetical protein